MGKSYGNKWIYFIINKLENLIFPIKNNVLNYKYKKNILKHLLIAYINCNCTI